jgi:hypothetical protein
LTPGGSEHFWESGLLAFRLKMRHHPILLGNGKKFNGLRGRRRAIGRLSLAVAYFYRGPEIAYLRAVSGVEAVMSGCRRGFDGKVAIQWDIPVPSPHQRVSQD